MMRVLVFGGTVEGRELACALAERGHDVCVSVATEAGVRAMPSGGEHLRVRCGALPHDEMLALMTACDVVVDATHPYARDISGHVARAAQEAGIELIRIVRPPSDTAGCMVVASLDDAVCAVGAQGNVLATTGSRGIGSYAAISGFEDRVFARVLDDESSIRACLDAGIPRSHVFAKNGSFSMEENLADIDACGASFLITKDSGEAGGYPAKLAACRERGIEMIVVERPHEEGVGVEEALEMIDMTMVVIDVSIVGIGMGAPGSETVRAREAICEADVLVGAHRMLEAAQAIRGAQGIAEADAMELGMPAKVAAFIVDCQACDDDGPGSLRIVVVCSGDTGFYSLATPLVDKLRAAGFARDVEVVPGITTVQHLAAKIGRPWQDCRLVSAHGRTVNVVGEVLSSPETFFLGGGTEMPDTIARKLVDAGLGSIDMVVGANLSYPDELIVSGTAVEIAQTEFGPLAAVWVSHGPLHDPQVADAMGFPGIPDDLFIRGDVPMTKRDVRAAISARVRPRDDELIVDIGAGTGSVSVELACLNPRARIVAVEENPGACALIHANRERFGAYNVEVVEGRAPEALGSMPVADTVFVGGSSGELEAILEAYAANSGCRRIVMTAATLETLAQATTVLERLKAQRCVESYDVTELSVARTREMGSHHLLRAENPVFIIEARVRLVIK